MARPEIPSGIHPEDEQFISQLASLQEMHDQIYHLRTLPQALVNPVSEMLRTQTLPSTGSEAPSKLYARIQKIAVEGLKDVENFKQSWLSDQSQALWRRTLNESCPQGSDAWGVDYVSAVEKSRAQERHRTLDTEISATDMRDPKGVIHNFREKHPSTKLETQDPPGFIPFNIRIAGMTFRVVFSDHSSKTSYDVQHKQGSKANQLQDGILKHLNQRRIKNNLEYLLDLLASYEDVKKRPCDKCLKLFDKTLTFPVIRNRKSSTLREGETDNQWEALHVDCT